MRFSLQRRFSSSRGRRSGRPHLGFRAKAVVFLLLLMITFIFVNIRLRPTLFEIAKAKARVLATNAINESIQTKVSQNLHYEDLIAVKVDNRGRVVLIQPNTGEINRLSSQAVIEIQKRLQRIKGAHVDIPLGQVLDNQVLGGIGPKIPISIIPIGTVASRVYDVFEQAGINQTRHKLYLEVKAQVKLIVPLSAANITVRTQVPLAEAIIMGEVPQVYFGGNPSVTLPSVSPESISP